MPVEENQASWSLLSTAPTVRAASAAPGDPMQPGQPELPAAITNNAPVSAVSWFTATLSMSVPS